MTEAVLKTGHVWALEHNHTIVKPTGWIANGLTLDSKITEEKYFYLLIRSIFEFRDESKVRTTIS